MGRKYLLIATLCICSCSSYSQDSTAYQKFFGKIVSSYEYASRNDKLNIYEILTLIARDCFSPESPLFIPALNYIRVKNNLTEPGALDLLYKNTMIDLKKDYLWKGSENIYKDNIKLFELYNQFFCSCIGKKVTRDAEVDKIQKATQQCLAEITTDTTFLNSLRQSAGENTINQLYELRHFTLKYLYGNCEIISAMFDQTIKDGQVTNGYYSAVQNTMRKKGEDVIRFYKLNKLDSLATLFPQYKNYIPALKKIIAFEKKQGIQKEVYYWMRTQEKNPPILITYNILTSTSSEARFIPSSTMLDAKIQSVSFKTIAPRKNNGEEEIIEEKVISTKTIKTN